MFEVLRAANVDWNVFAGAVATFIVTAVVTAFGFRRGMKRANQNTAAATTTTTTIAGATLMDNLSILMLTEALRDNTDQARQIHSCLVQLNLLAQLNLNKKD